MNSFNDSTEAVRMFFNNGLVHLTTGIQANDIQKFDILKVITKSVSNIHLPPQCYGPLSVIDSHNPLENNKRKNSMKIYNQENSN